MFRLLIILRVAAKYRLEEFLTDQPGTAWIRVLLFPLRIGSAKGFSEGSRNLRLRKALEELGPIYIKFGQLLSTRRDFLESALADELQVLQDNVPPFANPTIREILRDALDVDPSELFKYLEDEPFASASVAQVHRAELLNGEEVVVKVLRPGIRKTIEEDIKLLKWLAGLIESRSSFAKRLKPIEVINDYEKIILNELNLQGEAANTSLLKKNFKNSRVLYVPKIYWNYTRRNILVMERIHGIPVTDLKELRRENVDLKKLAETGVEIFFTQVFEHNFFHADMHPGNIFVSRTNTSEPQYIAIDCAIIGVLSNRDREYLAKNLLSIFKRDYRRVAELHAESGWIPKDTDIAEFEYAIRSVCEPIFEKPLKDISFGQLLVELFRTAGSFDMEVQPSLVLLQKTLLNIEGLGRQLYPDLDLWKTALPYLEDWNNKRLNPFNLLARIAENTPYWIEEAPNLLLSFMKAVEQSKDTNLNKERIDSQRSRSKENRTENRSIRFAGTIVLIAAAATIFLPFNNLNLNISALTLGLSFLGLYLLCFKG